MKSKKQNMFLIIEALGFLAYNVILFILTGFEHSAVFWLSWSFTCISCIALAAVMLLLGQKGMLMRDWLFGFPIVKHSTFYIIAQLVLSTIFIIFEYDLTWEWPFVVQFFLLIIYLVFAISCFLAKETIEGIKQKNVERTMNIKLLRANAESLAASCEDPALKAELSRFAENVRYSDPTSCDALQSLEAELARLVFACKEKVAAGEYAEASAICREAGRLLDERNQKCKLLKN
ncbi:MAG: hypothetical protein IKC69_00580 [Clostridia bacterium]|nr:hypothetical protein [Clostridia bacterium]